MVPINKLDKLLNNGFGKRDVERQLELVVTYHSISHYNYISKQQSTNPILIYLL